MYSMFQGDMPPEIKGAGDNLQHVCINRKHHIVAANVSGDREEGPICLWNYHGRHLHTGVDKMELCTNCGLETQFDTIAVAHLHPHRLRVGKISNTGIRFTWENNQVWINPELYAQWRVGHNSDNVRNPICSIQILNNDMLLTSYKDGIVALHDTRTPAFTAPSVHYHIAGPNGAAMSLMGAYALHEGTRATMINSIQDATRVVVGCLGSWKPNASYVAPQLCVYDMRMVHSTARTDAAPTSSSTATTSGDNNTVQRVQLPKGMRTMDVSGKMVAIAGADKIDPEDYHYYGSDKGYEEDPLFDLGLTTRIKGRSCAIQLWNAQRSLSKGPVAINLTPNQCSESRRRSPARLSDNGKHVYVPQRDGSVFVWRTHKGEGDRAVKMLRSCWNIDGIQDAFGYGSSAPYFCDGAYDRFHVDASDRMLVLGGYTTLVSVELGEGNRQDPLPGPPTLVDMADHFGGGGLW